MVETIYRRVSMKYNKRVMALVLALTILIMGVPSVFAVENNTLEQVNGARMKSRAIILGGEIIDGEVCTMCSVTGYSYTTSIDLLCILRQENSAGNLVIVDTWTDSGSGDHLYNEHIYSPAIEGREYEIAVRVGIYDENGLVGYDYETYSGIK